MEVKKYQNKFIFDYLRNILTTKSMEIFREHVNDKQNFNSFPNVVILRYLSMSPDRSVRELISKNQIFLERLDKISHEAVYRWYMENIPKQCGSFIRYIK